ncbi:plasmid replication protein RepC [uncultured Jannaschia sp.]|uniref:plasmid replication protein RepC n=1 Tax=uncultured Jannaschia sp. TaxID=293347 RepID=UPI002626B582|nr:plasmid replication protein RepC [uncultured Jannaschia sp.]
MGYNPVTPFRRAVDAAMLRRRDITDTFTKSAPVDKWAVLHALRAARKELGLSDRTLTVLQALLSFHKGDRLGESPAGHVVHASNAAICERLNGMPCSTMRRHVAHLVEAGLILRRDSPNGKRYVRRNADGPDVFGLDLTPLTRRFDEIDTAAGAARAETEAANQARHTASLMCRDLANLASYGRTIAPDGDDWDRHANQSRSAAQHIRRHLSSTQLHEIIDSLNASLTHIHDVLHRPEPSTSDNQNEQHRQESDKEEYKIDGPSTLDGSDHDDRPIQAASRSENTPSARNQPDCDITLQSLLANCSELQTYSPTPIRSWNEITRLASLIRPMTGISMHAWDEAVKAIGLQRASVVVAIVLQRFARIASPNAYFTALTTQIRRKSTDILSLMRRGSSWEHWAGSQL